MPKVLNVGGNDKSLPIPEHFKDWDHLMLDIDPETNADFVLDARLLRTIPDTYRIFDAVYCSHNLEHYYQHEVPIVLEGFKHVLLPDGFVDIRVPDIGYILSNNFTLDTVVWDAPTGPITAHHMLYGWSEQIEQSGKDYFAHKTGFDVRSLERVLLKFWKYVLIFSTDRAHELIAIAGDNKESIKPILRSSI